jgi:hypothetical protein
MTDLQQCIGESIRCGDGRFPTDWFRDPSNFRKRKGPAPGGTIVAASSLPEGIAKEDKMKKYMFAAGLITAIAAPAFADEVGVRVGPAGAGVTVGETHEYRDRDRDRTTIIKEREPADRTTVIKKEDAFGNREKTIIHHDRD